MLTSRIDVEQVVGLNVEEEGPIRDIFKPWDNRNDDDEKYLQSDSDEQMIIRIPFTGNVKLRSIFIRGARGECCPTQMKVYTNIPGIDFDSAESEKPTQIIDLVDSKEAVEYPVPASRYASVSIITLFFNQNAGGDNTQVYYIGFKGEFSKRAGRPGEIVYEAVANPADHVRLPGMGVGMHSSLGS